MKGMGLPGPTAAAAIVFAAAAAVSFLVIRAVERGDLRTARAMASDVAGSQAKDIEARISHSLSATSALAALVRQGNGSIRNFGSLVGEMLPYYAGASAMHLAPGGVIKEVAPIAGNEGAIGLDLLSEAQRVRQEAFVARSSGKLTLAGPIDLAQGGSGVVGRLPVELEDVKGVRYFWGFTMVLIRVPDLLQLAQLPLLAEQGYRYELWRKHPVTGARQTIQMTESGPPVDPVVRSVNLPGATWNLFVAPASGWNNPAKRWSLAAVGFVLSFFFAYLAKVTMELREHKAGLESEVARRTADLRVAAVAFESHEGMMITDAGQTILRVNGALTTITGYAAQEAVGRKPSLFKSSRHDAAFFDAMYRSLARTGAWQGEIWNRRKSGEEFPCWMSITAVTNAAGEVTHYVGALSDITERKAAEAEIERLAFHDALTGLPNRRLLGDRLTRALVSAARKRRCGAILFINLDDFKTLNDTQGIEQGDLLLRQVAERLTGCVREGDTVARFGGDEYVIMLEDLVDNRKEAASQTEAIGEMMLARLGVPYALPTGAHQVSASIGIMLFGGFGGPVGPADELLKGADLAMKRAKSAGGNTLRFFDPEMQEAVIARADLLSDLRQGLREGEFRLAYQAQVDREGRLLGAEALVRWSSPKRGPVSPADFIPAAEQTGLIVPLGQWVMETACAQLARWAEEPETVGLVMAVNVSAREFRSADFVEKTIAVLERTRADPRKLMIEFTESVLVDDLEGAVARMKALKERGVGFSLDDFGTGYSSLAYVKNLPVDQLKIDKSFVRDVLTDPSDAMIARAIIALATSLGLAVVAEGVESKEQWDFLIRHGCHAFQGYHIGVPGSVESLTLR